MSEAENRIFDQAVAWHLASGQDAMDWAGFTAWLEADPRHRTAYDDIALTDAALDDHRATLAVLRKDSGQPGRRRWALWLGGALAASLAALLIIPKMASPEARTFTSAGTARTVALLDGSAVILGPLSQLSVSGRDRKQLALRGGAYFAIRHDPARSLAVSAGGLQIRDVGTRFDLQTNGSAVRVEVSEGAVEVRGAALGDPVQLQAGRRMLFDPAHKLAILAAVKSQDVGEWREGRLTYDAAPLSLVAADLARYAGVSVSVPPPLAARRFSGTLSIHDGDSAVRDLAQLMGLAVSRRAGAYRFGQSR